MSEPAAEKAGKKRNWMIVVGVMIVAAAIVAAIAINTIQPLSVALTVTGIVVLVIVAVGLLPQAFRKRRRTKESEQEGVR